METNQLKINGFDKYNGYSGIQLLYSFINHKELNFGEEHEKCHLCGGNLTEKNIEKEFSDSWTNENACENRKTKRVCEACEWITQQENFQKSMYLNDLTDINMFYVYCESFTKKVDAKELLNMLEKQSIPLPFMIILRGDTMRYHTEIRSNKGITFDYNNVKIIYNCYRLMAIPDYITINGVVSLNSSSFIPIVYKLAELSKDLILPTIPARFEPTAKMLNIIKKLCKALKETNNYTEEGYWAAFFAGLTAGGETIDQKNPN